MRIDYPATAAAAVIAILTALVVAAMGYSIYLLASGTPSVPDTKYIVVVGDMQFYTNDALVTDQPNTISFTDVNGYKRFVYGPCSIVGYQPGQYEKAGK